LNAHPDMKSAEADRSDYLQARHPFDDPKHFFLDAASVARDMQILAWAFWATDSGDQNARLELAELFMRYVASDMNAFAHAVDEADRDATRLRRLHAGFVAATREGLRVQGWPAQRIDAFCADAEEAAANYDPVPPGARVGAAVE